MAKYWENSESKTLYWAEKPEAKRFWNHDADVSFYHSTAWKKARKVKLANNPLCEKCASIGVGKKGTIVDHIIPIRLGGDTLALDNLQTLCHSCHNSKSAKEKILK